MDTGSSTLLFGVVAAQAVDGDWVGGSSEWTEGAN